MKLFIFIIGFILAVFGGISLVAYLNLLTVGFSLGQYLLFIVLRVETYMFVTGLFIIWMIVYLPAIKKRRRRKMKK